MSDQCKNCQVRGNYSGCVATECFRHESWIDVQRINRITKLERLLGYAWVLVCKGGYRDKNTELRDSMDLKNE